MGVDVHRLAFRAYQSSPHLIKRIARKSYDAYISSALLGPSYKRDFSTRFFDSVDEFENYKCEFEQSDISPIVESARQEHEERTGHSRFAAINKYTSPRLYALVRKLEPTTVVETGVCNGVSTLIILNALHRNNHGRLYSVDYPDPERIPEGEPPGWIIPSDVRERWHLTTGKSQEELPEVISDLDAIDLFVHDTTAEIFDTELDIVWPKLREGAVVIADDIHKSDAFSEIKNSYPIKGGYIAPNVGYLIVEGMDNIDG